MNAPRVASLLDRRHEQPLIVELPREEQQISLRGARPIVPAGQYGTSSAQLHEAAIEIENRARIPTLVLHIFAAEILRQRQPRLGAGEAAVRARVPLHGSAASVASHADPGHVPLQW